MVADEAVAAVAVGGLDAQIGVNVDAIDFDQAGTEVLRTRYRRPDYGPAVHIEHAGGDEIASGGLVEAFEGSG